jgi:hypothetical protein
MFLRKSIGYISVFTGLLICAGVAAAQGPAENSDTTTPSLGTSAAVQTALKLNFSAASDAAARNTGLARARKSLRTSSLSPTTPTNPASATDPSVSIPAIRKSKPETGTFRPFGKAFALSTAVYWSAAAADVFSSAARHELNPFLRGSRGRIVTTRAAGFAAVPYCLSLLFEKKHSKLASVLRFLGGGVRFGAAIHNWRTR